MDFVIARQISMCFYVYYFEIYLLNWRSIELVVTLIVDEKLKFMIEL